MGSHSKAAKARKRRRQKKARIEKRKQERQSVVEKSQLEVRPNDLPVDNCHSNSSTH